VARSLRSKRFWVAACLIAALVVPAGVYAAKLIWQPNDITAIVRRAGFDPLIPPDRLRGPGSLYAVDGGSYQLVCAANPALLEGKVRKSPTETQVRQDLEKGAFSLGGDFVSAVNAKLGGSLLTSVEYRLTDVGISVIAYDDLGVIQNALLNDPRCDHAVHRFLKANKKVCPGYSALSATTLYRVNTDATVDSEAKAEAAVSATQSELDAKSHGDVRLRSKNELSGDDLFYGIRLSAFCVTFDDATEPIILPPAPTVVQPQPASGGVVMQTDPHNPKGT
jgi:hypothetical protein